MHLLVRTSSWCICEWTFFITLKIQIICISIIRFCPATESDVSIMKSSIISYIVLPYNILLHNQKCSRYFVILCNYSMYVLFQFEIEITRKYYSIKTKYFKNLNKLYQVTNNLSTQETSTIYLRFLDEMAWRVTQ